MQSKKIVVICGSKNDLDILQDGLSLMEEFKIPYQVEIMSAHRHPDKLREFCLTMEKKGAQTVIACAGMAAALPGFVAAYVNIPVIGVALKGGLMDGLDAVFSMVSIPKGLGVVCSGVGKSAFINAIIFSLEIIALKDTDYAIVLNQVKDKFK
jgi:5-(carboxyamino)imidazole ribonucleotide mutase